MCISQLDSPLTEVRPSLHINGLADNATLHCTKVTRTVAATVLLTNRTAAGKLYS